MVYDFILLTVLAAIIDQVKTLSALRYGSDSDVNDIKIEYRRGDALSYLTLDNSFDYINSGFAICLQQMSVSISTSDSNKCTLSAAQSGFWCLHYYVASGTTSYYYFELSDDYTVTSNLQTYTPSTVISGSSYGSISISLKGTLANGTSVNYLSSSESIYRLQSNLDRSFYGSSTVKSNYLSTYTISINVTTKNMILQRYYACFAYNNDLLAMIFYGGVYRFQTQLMVIGFVSISLTKTYFGAWHGLSYSEDHAFRDMMALIPHSGTLYDLKSLLAGAPYDDTSTNVGGTNDYTLLQSSNKQNQEAITYYYFNQFYRQYTTSDSLGDETVMYKMDNPYCVASYYQTYSSSSGNSFTATPTDSSYMHQTYGCFIPTLTLHEDKEYKWPMVVFMIGLMIL